MESSALFKTVKNWLNAQNIIIVLALSCFAPFVFTAIVTVAALLLIAFTPEFQRGLLDFRGALLIPAFCAYAFLIAFLNKNILGVIVAPVFLGILIIYCFVRRFINRETINTCYTAICAMVFPAFVHAVIETMTAPKSDEVYRCTAYFGNANYFGALMAVIIIICAHKVVSHNGKGLFYYIVAFTALVNIYLSGSLFAIIEVVVGVAIYLLLTKHYRLFCLMVIGGSLGIMLITTLPELLPRLSESGSATGYRVHIWGIIIREIKLHPFFGKGFMSYNIIKDLYEGSYNTVHSHNLVLDSMLNFGIVGTLLLGSMLYHIIRRVARVYMRDTSSELAAIALAVLAAIISHSFTDITFFWIQTGVFYVIVLGSIGPDEKRLNLTHDTLIRGRYRI